MKSKNDVRNETKPHKNSNAALVDSHVASSESPQQSRDLLSRSTTTILKTEEINSTLPPPPLPPAIAPVNPSVRLDGITAEPRPGINASIARDFWKVLLQSQNLCV